MARPIPPKLVQRLEREMVTTTPLTDRQLDVLALVANGYTWREIAALTNLSHHTILSHYENIRARLGAKNLSHAVALAMKSGVLDGELVE